MWIGEVDVEDDVGVRERGFEVVVEEGLDAAEQLVAHGGEEGEVVEVALAEAEEGAVADEAAEFEGWVEVWEVFAQDEVVGD